MQISISKRYNQGLNKKLWELYPDFFKYELGTQTSTYLSFLLFREEKLKTANSRIDSIARLIVMMQEEADCALYFGEYGLISNKEGMYWAVRFHILEELLDEEISQRIPDFSPDQKVQTFFAINEINLHSMLPMFALNCKTSYKARVEFLMAQEEILGQNNPLFKEFLLHFAKTAYFKIADAMNSLANQIVNIRAEKVSVNA